jgi:hypothetical protein
MARPQSRLFAIFLVIVVAVSFTRLTLADPEATAPAAAGGSAKTNLPDGQKRIKDEFKTVEQLIIRLAESYAKSDPKKAEILRQTFAASKERRVEGKLEDLVALLAKEQLFAATKSQAEVHQDLLKLLELLQSGDHDKQIADQQKRIKEYIARVNRIIKYEEQNRAQTEGEGETKDLAPREDTNAGRVDQLAKDIERTEGKSGENNSGKNESGKNESGKNDSGKSESGDSKSDASKSGDSKSEDSKSGDSKSGKNESGKSESGKNESGKSESGDSKSGDSKSGDSKSKESKSGDSKSGKNESGKSESGKTESGKSESGDSKLGDSKSKESKSGDSKSGHSKSGKSESGKSESGKSESGKSESGDSKSGDSKSGDSKSGDSKSGDSQSGDSERGDSKSGNSKSGNSKSGDSKSGDSESGDSESESQPMPEQQWSDDVPAKKRLKAAEERMRQAKIKLERANRKGATEDQKKAIEELELAKKELEEILRQLREEEIERMLAQLESRFRKMLEMQVQVHAGTMRLDRVPESARGRDDEIEALRLSRKEKQIADECGKAIVLLKEEGSAVAFPEAAEQMQDDMIQVMHRLERAQVGKITQDTEVEIIRSLEEMIAALQKAQRDAQAGGGGGGGGGGDEDQPLVDKIAELKMIRALQMRVNLRTQRYHKLLKDPELEQADKPDVIDALQRLSQREERIHETTRNIVVGKTE